MSIECDGAKKHLAVSAVHCDKQLPRGAHAKAQPAIWEGTGQGLRFFKSSWTFSSALAAVVALFFQRVVKLLDGST